MTDGILYRYFCFFRKSQHFNELFTEFSHYLQKNDAKSEQNTTDLRFERYIYKKLYNYSVNIPYKDSLISEFLNVTKCYF